MLQPIILAAGKGTRMQSELPKGLYPIAGKPMVRWVIEALEGIEDTKAPILVVGHKAELLRGELGSTYQYAFQEEVNGTASAVKTALPFLDPNDTALILFVDQPLLRPQSVEKIKKLIDLKPGAVIMGVVTVSDFNDWRDSFMKYGRVVRTQKGLVQRIVEYKDATPAERTLQELNAGLLCVKVNWLNKVLSRIKPSPISGEYYLTDVITMAQNEGKEIVVADMLPEEALGVNSQEDAIRVEEVIAKTQHPR